MAVTKDRGIRTLTTRENAQDSCLTLEAVIRGRFQRSPYLPLRNIRCFVHDGVLTLRGHVPTYYLKQLAQTIGGSFLDVQRISNELFVEFPDR
jgi:hypothetical protein